MSRERMEELGRLRTKRDKIMRYLGLSDHGEHIAWRSGEDWADAACRAIEERDTMLTALLEIAEDECDCYTLADGTDKGRFVKCSPCIAKEAIG